MSQMSVTGRPSRRRFLRGIGFGGLGLVAGALGTGALGACGGTDLAPVPLRTGMADLSRAQRVVRFANWPDYVDSLPGNHLVHPTLVEFTRRTGIVVEYSEPVRANDQFVGQMGVQLALGRSPGYGPPAAPDSRGIIPSRSGPMISSSARWAFSSRSAAARGTTSSWSRTGWSDSS